MQKSHKPDNEFERQAALDALDLVYSPPEERFERITRLTKRLFDVPIALISLVSNDVQWFKSRQGLTVPETSREISFCAHAILRHETFVVPNAAKDPDFDDNPLVTGPPHIRFYAGQPVTVNGQRIGTLCIIDTRPRHFKPRDYDSIKSLAMWVELEMSMQAIQREVHKLPDRQGLLDPVTGDFNKAGFDSLQKMLADDSDSPQMPPVCCIGIPQPIHQRMSPESLKKLSGTIHKVVNDKGLVSYDPDSGFNVLIPPHSSAEVEEVSSELREVFELPISRGELQVAVSIKES